MNNPFNIAQLRATTKALVAGLFVAGNVMQVREVHDWALAAAHNHPHIIIALGTAFGIAGLLHNPAVQAALGKKTTVAVTTQTVEVNPEDKK